MRTSFRTKVFFAAVSAAAVSLIVASVLWSWQVRERQRDEIARRLTNEARLIADLLSGAPGGAAFTVTLPKRHVTRI